MLQLLQLDVCGVDLITYSKFVLFSSTNSGDGAVTMIAQIILLPPVVVIRQSLRPSISVLAFLSNLQLRFTIVSLAHLLFIVTRLKVCVEFCVLLMLQPMVHLGFLGD